MRYKIVLTKRGEEIFKGGNIEVMKKYLLSFEAENFKEALKIFNKYSLDFGLLNWGYYELKEVLK